MLSRGRVLKPLSAPAGRIRRSHAGARATIRERLRRRRSRPNDLLATLVPALKRFMRQPATRDEHRAGTPRFAGAVSERSPGPRRRRRWAPRRRSGSGACDWVKGKVKGATATALAEAPEDAKAQAKLEGALEQVLEAEPALADELRRLVEAAEPEAARLEQTIQTMTVQGDHNVSVQSKGDGNTYTINKG